MTIHRVPDGHAGRDVVASSVLDHIAPRHHTGGSPELISVRDESQPGCETRAPCNEENEGREEHEPGAYGRSWWWLHGCSRRGLRHRLGG